MSRSLALRAGALAVWLLSLALCACGAEELREVPPFLRGQWTTEAPRYAGRSLEIGAREVVFRGPQGILDRVQVERVEHRGGSKDAEQVYVLHYALVGGGDDTLRLTFLAEADPSLRIGSRADRWTRGGPS